MLNATALQFISTSPLADFSTSRVVLDLKTSATHLWVIGDSQNSSTLEGNNFSDTETTCRGFLPFANSTLRENLMTHSGSLIIVEERVACVQPNLSNLAFHILEVLDNTVGGTLALSSRTWTLRQAILLL
ncbi:hypothetical protein ACN47E_000987 [Coniothyrium glycines]